MAVFTRSPCSLGQDVKRSPLSAAFLTRGKPVVRVITVRHRSASKDPHLAAAAQSACESTAIIAASSRSGSGTTSGAPRLVRDPTPHAKRWRPSTTTAAGRRPTEPSLTAPKAAGEGTWGRPAVRAPAWATVAVHPSHKPAIKVKPRLAPFSANGSPPPSPVVAVAASRAPSRPRALVLPDLSAVGSVEVDSVNR